MNLRKRFNIFIRDNFTCKYCGRRPPEVILEVDHAISKKDGGLDNDENLVTSCFECNRGKSKKSVKNINYNKEIKKIEEAKLQMEEYYLFLKEKDSLKNKELDIFNDYWLECSNHSYILSDIGLKKFKKIKEEYPLEDILDSIKIAWGYEHINPEDKIKYIIGILKVKKSNRENPEEAERQKIIRENINKFYSKWKEFGKSNYIKWDLKVLIKDIFEHKKITWDRIEKLMDDCFKDFNKSGYQSYSDYIKDMLESLLKIFN